MLKDNHNYRNGRGRIVSIIGRTKDHETFVYSRHGDWYVRETGQFLFYNPKTGEHAPHNSPTLSDIVDIESGVPIED